MADAGIIVNIDIAGLQRKLKKVGVATTPRGLLKAIGQRHVKWISDNFKSSGGLVGGWAPLSALTIALRGPGQPLMDKGILRASFGEPLVTDTEVKVGGGVPYASFHEQGTGPIYPVQARALKIGPYFFKSTKGVPKRRMLPTVLVAKELAVALVDARIKEAARG